MPASPERRAALIAAICFSLTLVSGFGQTFFIALFGDDIRACFDLSDGGFGMIYSAATLASGVLMIWVGAVVDRVSFRRYSIAAALILAVAAALFATAGHVLVLALAIFGLRLGGQGMMSHAAQVGVARAFSGARGRALGLANLGHPAGEAAFPAIAVALVAVTGWQNLWLGIAVTALAVALVYARMVPAGLRDHHTEAMPPSAAGPASSADDPSKQPAQTPDAGRAQARALARDWSRGEVLRDRRFYLLLPALMGPGFVSTGIFFHQLPLIQEKGWPLSLYASAFVAFAIGVSVSMIGSGALVDRFGARVMMRGYLLPWAAACLMIAFLDARWSAFAFMALAGISQGAAATTVTAMWAETYGVTHLGSIRAMATAIMVVSTAIAPGLLGTLLDAGVGFAAIATGCALYLAAASVLAGLALARARGSVQA
ncbi:MFS transporter [Rhodothalassium salexigens DSM 2132]|uniref:MFS transporter n=2 Tax=Rhodothalassium salexigens TaxID=1086 RepID=A0A4V2SQ74_RHOSA|nr:MFS transporter [Rhodothalassium salexigens]MBB4210497.1 MFS family permease [Rhodothalassium salexigens DSM 2132]TCP37946.1 MFS transporter [Rhodothalassium salexigens DSM 2132]